jgi:predicted acyl esterase
MLIRTDYPRPARTVENLWIALPDGCRLAARMWLPEDADAAPVPAVLDAVPYRKGDGTEARDATRYPYIAGHGYACVRLDLRGSGDSEGLIEDEYGAEERDDVEAVIAWLAAQPWCDGAVGMIGVSWGGFAALQAAARNPPALRGIVAIHCSDDRYADDVHYIGGCVLASDMLHWSACMTAYTAQPPDPAVVGENWRAAWRERLESAQPWVATWLAHQRRDEYWRQGSACERYREIACPVFAVGGWVDGYRDSVLRLVENVRGPVRGLIGPWGHTWPERGAPGPAIGFLREVVRFFDCALKGSDNGFLDEPRLVSWMQERIGPVTSCAQRPGRWVADPAWPSPNIATCALPLGAGHAPRSLRGLQLTGGDGGVWCGDGGPADLPGDQRAEDGASLCWDFEPLEERLELLGHAAAVLELQVDRPRALVAVRLCDVAPDGSSSLIARGLLNLTHREGHDRIAPLVPGEAVTVRVPMQSTAYAVPAGHSLRLAVSPTYWPWAWPSPEPVTLTVRGGAVELPVRSGPDTAPVAFGPPECAPEPPEEVLASGPTGRVVTRDLAAGAAEARFAWIDGRSLLTASATELAERNVVRYRLVEGDPLTAAAGCEVDVELARGDWRTRVEVRSAMTCDRERFLVTTELDAFEGPARSFARRWTHEILRDGG